MHCKTLSALKHLHAPYPFETGLLTPITRLLNTAHAPSRIYPGMHLTTTWQRSRTTGHPRQPNTLRYSMLLPRLPTTSTGHQGQCMCDTTATQWLSAYAPLALPWSSGQSPGDVKRGILLSILSPRQFPVATTVDPVDRLGRLSAAATVCWTTLLRRLDRSVATKTHVAVIQIRSFINLTVTH